MIKMTLDDYLASKGLSSPYSNYVIDKLRANGHPDNESTQAARRICEKTWNRLEKVKKRSDNTLNTI